MRNVKPGLATLSALTLIAFSSCLMGLDPAWKTRDTSLSVSLPQIAETSGDARALVRGTGFLYLRTLGGPTGTAGPLYGPFQISSSSFETKLIPPGKYSDILVLYSSVDLSAKAVGDTGKTFHEIMALPDSELAQYIDPAEGTESLLDSVIDGYGSVGETGTVTIQQGIRNVLPTLTLKPVTAGSEYQGSEGFLFNISSPAGTMTRRFFFFDGIVSGATYDNLECYFTATSTDGSKLGRVGLYEEDGTLIYMSAALGTVEADTTKTIEVPFTGSEAYYAYIEYEGGFDVQTVGVYSAAAVTVSVSGNTALAGSRVFFGIYNAADIVTDMVGGGVPDNPVALGVTGELDSSGAGSGGAFLPGTSDDPTLTPGAAYAIMCFADLNDLYAGITTVSGLADSSGILPHYGDYTSDDPVIFLGGDTITIDASTFEPNGSYVYFVSSTGSSSADGQLVSTATTLAAALDDMETRYANGTGIDSFEIYLASDTTLSSSVNLLYDLSINSLGSTAYTINWADTSGYSAFLVGDSETSSPSLILNNVIFEGNGISRDQNAFYLNSGSSLALIRGAAIQNIYNPTMYGGAISMYYADLILSESSITGCKAVNGGAVYAYGSSMVYLGSGSVISGNTASDSVNGLGGGLYIGSYSALYLEDGTVTPSVTGNKALIDGGGVYIEEGGYLYDDSGIANAVIQGNYLTDGTTVSNLVYTIPPVMIYFENSGAEFDVDGNYEGLVTDTFEFSAPAGFDSYTWELNGVIMATGVSSISFVPQELSTDLWWEGENNVALIVTLDGVPYSVTGSIYIGEYSEANK